MPVIGHCEHAATVFLMGPIIWIRFAKQFDPFDQHMSVIDHREHAATVLLVVQLVDNQIG